ncbi:hypothetical protein EZY14_018110 [Kordia sp. TARA_039_SRF]|nr:hypothetical protein EZY14_018110 [Kordia sp. TARA_039_SRF]
MKKINSKLLLKKKTVSNLNDMIGGENPESVSITPYTIFLTKYCGTANCSAFCGGTTFCQTRGDESCLVCPPDTNNYCS